MSDSLPSHKHSNDSILDASVRNGRALIERGLAQETFEPNEHHLDSTQNTIDTLNALRTQCFSDLERLRNVDFWLSALMYLTSPMILVSTTSDDTEPEDSRTFRKHCLALILEHSESLVDACNSDIYGPDAISAFRILLTQAEQLHVDEAYREHIESAIKQITFRWEQEQDEAHRAPILGELILLELHGDKEHVQKAHAKIPEILEQETAMIAKRDFLKTYLRNVIHAKEDQQKQLTETSLEAIRPLFERCGVPMGWLLVSWQDSHAGYPYAEYVAVTLQRMLEVDLEAPGAIAWLYRERDIRAFTRYSNELLLDQFRKREVFKTAKRSPVIFVTAQHDYAGKQPRSSALLKSGKYAETAYTPFSFLIDPPPLLLLEADNPVSLKRKIDAIINEMPADATGKPIIIINGHGDQNQIILSGQKRLGGSRVISEHLIAKHHRYPLRSGIFDSERGYIGILSACETGKGKKSLGKHASRSGDIFASSDLTAGGPILTIKDSPDGVRVESVTMSNGKGAPINVRVFRKERK